MSVVSVVSVSGALIRGTSPQHQVMSPARTLTGLEWWCVTTQLIRKKSTPQSETVIATLACQCSFEICPNSVWPARVRIKVHSGAYFPEPM